MQFYSEYGEDKWCSENLHIPERGFYLDIGAAHPERESNTAFLRDKGWLGLAVDAVSEYAPHWVGRQQFLHAILSPHDVVKFKHIKHNSPASRIVKDDPEGKRRSAVTLQYLLNCTIEKASPPI